MHRSIEFVKRYPFAMLLAVQLFSIVFYGFMTDSKTSHFVFNCLGLIVPILAVWVVFRSPMANWVGFALITLSISTSFAVGKSGSNKTLCFTLLGIWSCINWLICVVNANDNSSYLKSKVLDTKKIIQ